MIAVADTSPLNYLIQIDAIDLLPILFEQVLIPPAVLRELEHSQTPQIVCKWISHPPAWVLVRANGPTSVPPLLRLDLGEREAIQLALEFKIGTVLMDEAEGRRVAEPLGLEVRGTLGVLERGARLGRIDLRRALHELEQTNFRVSPELRAAILERNHRPSRRLAPISAVNSVRAGESSPITKFSEHPLVSSRLS